jgi:hypothetical protein
LGKCLITNTPKSNELRSRIAILAITHRMHDYEPEAEIQERSSLYSYEHRENMLSKSGSPIRWDLLHQISRNQKQLDCFHEYWGSCRTGHDKTSDAAVGQPLRYRRESRVNKHINSDPKH